MKIVQSIVYTAIAFFILSCNSEVKKEDIPAEITSSFEKAFPETENVEWKTKGEDYEATFTKGEEEITIRFKTDGTYEEVDREAEDDEDVETILHTVPIP